MELGSDHNEPFVGLENHFFREEDYYNKLRTRTHVSSSAIALRCSTPLCIRNSFLKSNSEEEEDIFRSQTLEFDGTDKCCSNDFNFFIYFGIIFSPLGLSGKCLLFTTVYNYEYAHYADLIPSIIGRNGLSRYLYDFRRIKVLCLTKKL